MRSFTTTLVLLFSFLLVKCTVGHHDAAGSLVGSWRSDAREGQLGSSVNTICFRSDGTLESVIDTQAGPIVARGSYKLSGDSLVMSVVGGVEQSETVKIRLSSDVLTITSDNGVVNYRRVATSCAKERNGQQRSGQQTQR